MFYRLGKKLRKNSDRGWNQPLVYVQGLIIHKLIAVAEVPGWRLNIASRAAARDVDIARKVFTKLKASHYIS